MLLLYLLTACRSQAEYAEKPTKSLVNTENDLVELNVQVYHRNDSVSSLFLQISNENLLYKYSDTAQFPYARLKLRAQLYSNGKGEPLIDTLSVLLYDRATEDILNTKYIYATVNLKATFGQSYRVDLQLIDLNKRIQYSKALVLRKKDRLNRQNFLLSRGSNLLFGTAGHPGDSLLIRYPDVKTGKLWCDEFEEVSYLAPPPFSTKAAGLNLPAAKRSFTLDGTDGLVALSLPQYGFVHLRAEQSSKEGLTVFVFGSSFPGIASAEDMIRCTRYIMTREEYQSCMDAPNKKLAIDKFWLERGGSNERAKELLKRYYARVKEANKLYSGLTEGWRSDRGMIFIVFGQPSNIQFRDEEEIWTYGNPVQQSTTTFVFRKFENPYSENVYELERSAFYKGIWSNAVDLWRQGIYLEGRK